MKFKGQSAIEYLSTYGWMMVVVALGASIFYNSYVPEDTCRQEVISQTTGQIQVVDMAMDPDEDLAVLLRNFGDRQATMERITISDGESSTSVESNETLVAVEEKVFRLSGVEQSERCNEFEMTLQYDSQEIGAVEDEATIQSEFDIK